MNNELTSLKDLLIVCGAQTLGGFIQTILHLCRAIEEKEEDVPYEMRDWMDEVEASMCRRIPKSFIEFLLKYNQEKGVDV